MMKRWQGENGGPRQRLPLAGQGTGGSLPPAEKFGRDSLASSHAGTRLPIAAWPARTQGAPPRPAPGSTGAPETFSLHAPFVKRVKKRRGPRWAARRVRPDDDFLRWHYPHQVEGRSGRFLSAEWLPCVFTRPIMAPPTGVVKGGGKKIVKKIHGLPLQCGKKRRILNNK